MTPQWTLGKVFERSLYGLVWESSDLPVVEGSRRVWDIRPEGPSTQGACSRKLDSKLLSGHLEHLTDAYLDPEGKCIEPRGSS